MPTEEWVPRVQTTDERNARREERGECRREESGERRAESGDVEERYSSRRAVDAEEMHGHPPVWSQFCRVGLVGPVSLISCNRVQPPKDPVSFCHHDHHYHYHYHYHYHDFFFKR